MFNRKTTPEERRLSSSQINIIGETASIEGDLHCEGDLRIDGHVKGTVYSKAKVLIGPHGKLDGNLECREGEIMGYIKGTLRVEGLLYLRGEAVVTGDVQTCQFEMEPTVKFNGRCQMAETANSHVTSKGELTIVEQEKATRRAAEKETAVLG